MATTGPVDARPKHGDGALMEAVTASVLTPTTQGSLLKGLEASIATVFTPIACKLGIIQAGGRSPQLYSRPLHRDIAIGAGRRSLPQIA